MIAGLFHKGSGLGNQLHRYVMTRVLALDKGYEFGMVAPEHFKGKDFMNLDMGIYPNLPYHTEHPSGKLIVDHPEVDLWEEWGRFCYDPDINFVQDNTVIDGNFEDERYFEHRIAQIDKWLEVKPIIVQENKCLIGFRGGEYYAIPELGLPREYFDRAIKEMRKLIPDVQFEVHTDDPDLARQFFPNYQIIRDVGINWRAMRFAKWAIIANSSFYVLPRLLSRGVTCAPRYWNRYNINRWDYPQNYYKEFQYI